MSYKPEKLRAARERKGLTQARAALAYGNHAESKTVITAQQISNWELGARPTINSASLSILADIYSVSADYLLGRCDQPNGRTTKRKAGV